MASLEGDVVIPPVGRVKLSDKLMPVCERKRDEQPEHLTYTLGRVDVSAFKAKLRALPAEAWEDEKAAESNVRLTRPAHDAWGIKKVIFTFCDDFLQKVLDLPYSQSDEWHTLLAPIYEAIGVDEKRIVRSLLASMPPGLSIPVHHDTGYWVKHTHRVHVAIDTGPGVDFLVGRSDDDMHKHCFDEGRIVELNNQAKHAVVNNWDRNRIHLIFDFVDDFPLTRYLLTPGEEVRQTRRSLDLVREEGSRPAPSFLIIGAQKCGTTR